MKETERAAGCVVTPEHTAKLRKIYELNLLIQQAHEANKELLAQEHLRLRYAQQTRTGS